MRTTTRIQARQDTLLVGRALGGDADSYGALVDRYSGRIINLAYRMVGDRHLAEDVAQETFIRAYRALRHFQRKARFSSWLYQIALNLCRDHLKSRARGARSVEREALAAMDGGETRSGAPRQAMKSEFSGALQMKIHELPFAYREAFILRHLHDLEYEEIAEITGVSADTVRVRAYRARELLKKSLASQVDTYWREKEKKDGEKQG